MPLFLVTGLPGSGKSAVNAELKSRGYESYDGDEDHLARWYNDETGQEVEAGIEDCTPEFLSKHSRSISRKVVEELALKAKTKPVFLCGDPENEENLNDLFSKVFALIIDEKTREYRLTARTNNVWGKRPHEREYSAAFGKKWKDICLRLKYTHIDSSQPTKNIVDQILKEVN